MPRGAAPLAEYTRYYTGEVLGGSGLVEGVLLKVPRYSNDAPINIVPPAAFPAIADGGCGVIYLLYDVDLGRVTSIACNSDG